MGCKQQKTCFQVAGIIGSFIIVFRERLEVVDVFSFIQQFSYFRALGQCLCDFLSLALRISCWLPQCQTSRCHTHPSKPEGGMVQREGSVQFFLLLQEDFFFFLGSSQKLDRPMGLDCSWGPSSLRFKALSPILEASQGLFCGRKG